MAAFLRHSSAVTQLQSNQLLLLQWGANTETKGLSAKHTQNLEHQGRGTWLQVQNANLTVQLMEVPLLIHSAKVRLDMLCSGMDREIHLHKCVLWPYTPMSFSLCLLCPFKSFVMRWQHIVNIVTAKPGTSCCV